MGKKRSAENSANDTRSNAYSPVVDEQQGNGLVHSGCKPKESKSKLDGKEIELKQRSTSPSQRLKPSELRAVEEIDAANSNEVVKQTAEVAGLESHFFNSDQVDDVVIGSREGDQKVSPLVGPGGIESTSDGVLSERCSNNSGFRQPENAGRVRKRLNFMGKEHLGILSEVAETEVPINELGAPFHQHPEHDGRGFRGESGGRFATKKLTGSPSLKESQEFNIETRENEEKNGKTRGKEEDEKHLRFGGNDLTAKHRSHKETKGAEAKRQMAEARSARNEKGRIKATGMKADSGDDSLRNKKEGVSEAVENSNRIEKVCEDLQSSNLKDGKEANLFNRGNEYLLEKGALAKENGAEKHVDREARRESLRPLSKNRHRLTRDDEKADKKCRRSSGETLATNRGAIVKADDDEDMHLRSKPRPRVSEGLSNAVRTITRNADLVTKEARGRSSVADHAVRKSSCRTSRVTETPVTLQASHFAYDHSLGMRSRLNRKGSRRLSIMSLPTDPRSMTPRSKKLHSLSLENTIAFRYSERRWRCLACINCCYRSQTLDEQAKHHKKTHFLQLPYFCTACLDAGNRTSFCTREELDKHILNTKHEDVEDRQNSS